MRFERILKMLNSRKNRKKGIHRNATGRFILFFDILCKIVYSIECAKKNNGGTPIWRPRALFWPFLHNISKNKINGPAPLRVMPI